MYYTSPVATVTNVVAVYTVVNYPIVSVFVTVSEFITGASYGSVYRAFYGWILIAVGLALCAVVVAVIPFVRRKTKTANA